MRLHRLVSALELGTAEIGLFKVHLFKIGFSEVSPFEIGSAENSFALVGPRRLRPLRLGYR